MAKEYDVNQLKELVNKGNPEEIAKFMKENDLVLNDQTIESIHKKEFHILYEEYYLKQLIKKLALNASYGALINTSSIFYDFRLGASTTMSGRKIWQNLSSAANEFLAGTYEPNGVSLTYGDTDSFGKNTKITINNCNIKIEDYYNSIKENEIVDVNGVYIKRPENDIVLTTKDGKNIINSKVNYVMKHKVNKEMFEISCEGKSIIITCDHSIMVMRNEKIISVKPSEIKKGDKLVINNYTDTNSNEKELWKPINHENNLKVGAKNIILK